MGATVTKSSSTCKSADRSIRVLSPGRIVIRVGNGDAEYAVGEFICGLDGRGFRLEKFGGEQPYDVFLARNGRDSTCECLGFLRHGRCKHVAGLTALLHRGKLDDTPAVAV